MPLPPITPIGVGTAAQRPTQAWSADFNNWLVSPGTTNPPIIFEPPPALNGGQNEAWIAASGGAEWGGCQVWVSLDGTTYGLVGTLYKGCVTGVLSAPLPWAASPDTTDTLSVDLTQSAGQLLSGTLADTEALVTLCCVDGELIAYQTATLTAPFKYNLGACLVRGAYGTPIGAHAAGTAFARLNGSVFKYPFPQNLIPATFYVKLPAFNIYGQALQELSAVGASNYTTTGAGIDPLSNPLLTALAGGLSEDWGIVGAPVNHVADLGSIAIATGLDIDLGTLS